MPTEPPSCRARCFSGTHPRGRRGITVFVNNMINKICLPQNYEVTAEWRKLRKEAFHEWCSLPGIKTRTNGLSLVLQPKGSTPQTLRRAVALGDSPVHLG